MAFDANELPSAQFADLDEDDGDPWDVLRRAAAGEGTVMDLCGSAIILRADADGWRQPVKVA